MKQTFLIVGLGNPEGKYFQTFHNVGFLCADKIAESKGIDFVKKGNMLIAGFRTNEHPRHFNSVFVQKPLTYMNNSGQAVVHMVRKYKILPENIVVLTDDVYIDKGNIRIAKGGSGAGHNGIKSINELLGSNQYIKIRIGVKPEKAPHSMSDYVLSRIDDRLLIDAAIEKAATAAVAFVHGEKLDKLQAMYNVTNTSSGEVSGV